MTRARLVVLLVGAAAVLMAAVALQGTPGVPLLAPIPSTPDGKCLYFTETPLNRDDEEALRKQLDA